jgi:hypothetical protein
VPDVTDAKHADRERHRRRNPVSARAYALKDSVRAKRDADRGRVGTHDDPQFCFGADLPGMCAGVRSPNGPHGSPDPCVRERPRTDVAVESADPAALHGAWNAEAGAADHRGLAGESWQAAIASHKSQQRSNSTLASLQGQTSRSPGGSSRMVAEGLTSRGLWSPAAIRVSNGVVHRIAQLRLLVVIPGVRARRGRGRSTWNTPVADAATRDAIVPRETSPDCARPPTRGRR